MDELIERGRGNATFYNHFPSKDHLALATLEERERLWTKGWVEAEFVAGDARRGNVYSPSSICSTRWFHRDDLESCSFVNVLLEQRGAGSHPPGRAAADYLENIRAVVGKFAKEAGFRAPAYRSRRREAPSRSSPSPRVDEPLEKILEMRAGRAPAEATARCLDESRVRTR